MKRILQAMDGVATKPVAGANDMAKFLSIVDKNSSIQILTEATNPHKVSLPVQMAMQHYQKEEIKPKARVGKTSVVSKYFHQVEQELEEQSQAKHRIMNQYASTIAKRVLMKESVKDKIEKSAEKKAIQELESDHKTYKNSYHHNFKLDEKSKTEKQARFMAAAAHDPAFAARTGIKQSVAKEFNKADTGTKQLSNAMKHKPKKKVSENEISGHSMGYKPGAGNPGIMPNEAQDPNFVGFMNKAMGTRQDKAPIKYDPNTVMGMHNMPGYKKAFKFGMDVIKRLDQETKEHFAQEDDNEFLSYLIDIAKKKGLIPRSFAEEDLDEVTGEFEEIFRDPEMEGWSWADLLRDSIGQTVRAHEKANVQAHKQMVAKAEANKNKPVKIDPSKLKVVTRSDTKQSEIWYPHSEFFGTPAWAIVQDGFKDRAHAEQGLEHLKSNPNIISIIKKAIAKEEGMDEGMSAQVKLSRAWDREKAKSTASIERAKQAKAEFEKEWKAKQEKKSQEPNPIKEANAKKRTLKNSNPCWDGYKPVGTKKKGSRTVPNCVPKE